MNFGFNPPDPNDVIETMQRLKDAFAKAASANTGSAQPLFQTLSDSFAKAVDAALDLQQNNPGIKPQQAMMQLMPTLMQVQGAVQRLEQAARTNPAAAEALSELKNDMQTEMRGLLGGMPGFPGAGQKPPSVPPKPPKPPAPKPRGPGRDGSHDL
ncbi:MAG: hypothetical protein RBS08_04090 [Bdellovibrionales bacterium]|jgi:hypothetical protein|nr:hypothetical protein [Bdellovibrionales bacterium]